MKRLVTNELADLSYIPEEPTDYNKSQQATKDQPIQSHTEETKYLVFWSCLALFVTV